MGQGGDIETGSGEVKPKNEGVYFHIYNGGVTFKVEHKETGPQVEVSSSYFGNVNQKMTVMTNKKSLEALAAYFTQQAAAAGNGEYCHSAHVPALGRNTPQCSPSGDGPAMTIKELE